MPILTDSPQDALSAMRLPGLLDDKNPMRDYKFRGRDLSFERHSPILTRIFESDDKNVQRLHHPVRLTQ
jgi:hypothetical protein